MTRISITKWICMLFSFFQKKRLLCLNLASTISLENKIWLTLLRLCGHFGTLFFIFFIRFQAYLTSFAWFLFFLFCFFSQIALRSFGPSDLRPPVYCSALHCWERTQQSHRPLCACITVSGAGREQIQVFSSSQSRLVARWRHSGPAGTMVAITGSVPPLQCPWSTQLCLPFTSLLSVRKLFQPENVSCVQPSSDLQTLWMPELVSGRFLFL